MWDVMSAMGYDLINVGKRDFADTAAVWLQERKEKKPLFLTGNIADSTGKYIGEPYFILEHNGMKIGVVAALSLNYRNYFRQQVLRAPVEVISDAQKEFRKEKVDFQFLIYMGRKKESIDVISTLEDFDLLLIGNSDGKPMEAQINDGQVPIVGPGDRCRELAVVTMTREKREHPATVTCDIVPLGDGFSDSPKWLPFDKIFKDKLAADARAQHLRNQQLQNEAKAKSGN